MKHAQPGDVILFYYKDNMGFWDEPISWLISSVQGHQVTHSGIIYDPKKEIIIDAYYPKIRIIKLEDMYDPKNYRTEIVRVKNASIFKRFLATYYAKTYIGSKYDFKSWISLARALLIERWFKVPIRQRYRVRDNPRKLFCQELVTQCYHDAGFDFAGAMGFKDPSAILPKDVYENKNKVFELVEKSE